MILSANCQSNSVHVTQDGASKDTYENVTLTHGEYSSSPVETPHSHYIVAIRNKKTNKTQFVSVPIHRFARNEAVSAVGTVDKSMDARNKLGQQFGSKKRKLDIKQQVENKVDVDSVNHVASAIMTNIETAAQDLPTTGKPCWIVSLTEC